MSRREGSGVSDLRNELVRAAQIPDLAERTLEVVAVVEAIAAPLGIHPVIVGGVAVYFWTASDEFLTYDIDVVMEVPDALAAKLTELGFSRAKNGRHWLLEGTEVMLEAPSSQLDADVVVAEIELRSGRTAKVISRVDVLLDRLAEFQATGHETAAQQALALLVGVSAAEGADVDARAANRKLGAMLNTMRALAKNVAEGGSFPDSGELHQIAQEALRTEYPR